MALTVEQKNDLDFILKNLLAGGVAGMCAKTTVAPLDRMKILLQAQSSHYKHHGVLGGLAAIVKNESLIALYKGNGAQMVRIFPYAATQFTSFEIYKTYLSGIHLPIVQHGDKFIAGAGAGVTAVTLTYPLDTIRARLAFQITGQHRYKGIVHAATTMFRTHGDKFIAGAGAGVTAVTLTYPLDTIRARLAFQITGQHRYKGIVHAATTMFRTHGDKFIAGAGAGVTAVTLTYPLDTIRARLAFQITGQHRYKGIVHAATTMFRTHGDKFIAGAGAGVTAVTLTYPLDTIRARLAFQITGQHRYKGIVHAATTMFRTEGGIRALYRGFVPTMCGMVPYAGFSFYCFESLKFCCMKYLPNTLCRKCERNTGGLVLTVPGKLVCGGLAGAVAQSISYPLDVTRRRMQLACMDARTAKFGTGMVKTLTLIYRENGIVKGLYRGMSINYIRAIPMVATSFSTYELMKQLLQLDTGMKVS
ncbi:hypothetical protein PYW07_005000 [Mythimna separata]|uniref:Graves disease carrier protein n=1 Tax=Mythimna separata TaxID=271217 RepID=A0AAD7YEW9_MYTSE|nr:hypothetical protein PYW07_005000 [Mythimna separata]